MNEYNLENNIKFSKLKRQFIYLHKKSSIHNKPNIKSFFNNFVLLQIKIKCLKITKSFIHN